MLAVAAAVGLLNPDIEPAVPLILVTPVIYPEGLVALYGVNPNAVVTALELIPVI